MRSGSQWTTNFNQREFSVSNSFPDLVEEIPIKYVNSMMRLVENGLQPLRDYMGSSMRILSGYRSPELNKAVGGSRTSQHVVGEAADFTCAEIRQAVYALIDLVDKGMLQGIGQVIYYPDQGFIHMALESRRYPVPTLCIHWPSEDYNYTQCLWTREAFDDMVPPSRDPNN